MKLLILIILAVAHAVVIEDKCDGVFIQNIYHDREILKDGLDSPYQLALDFDTQLLFFSLSGNVTFFVSAYINLKTNDFGIIPGINGGFANAIDAKKHVMYLGGYDGIYTFDFDSKTATHVAGNHSVWQMFYKDRLYYTEYPNENAYYYESGVTKKVEELKNTKARFVALDNDANILFSNSSGLFMYKRENATILNVGEYIVNGFTIDINGNLYFSTPAAMYSINGQQVVKLVELNTMFFGMAIDGENNIIYADSENLFKLTPSKKACSADEKEITSRDV